MKQYNTSAHLLWRKVRWLKLTLRSQYGTFLLKKVSDQSEEFFWHCSLTKSWNSTERLWSREKISLLVLPRQEIKGKVQLETNDADLSVIVLCKGRGKKLLLTDMKWDFFCLVSHKHKIQLSISSKVKGWHWASTFLLLESHSNQLKKVYATLHIGSNAIIRHVSWNVLRWLFTGVEIKS